MRIAQHGEYKTAFKKAKRRGEDGEIEEIVNCIAEGKPLPARCKDHELVGNWKGVRECHIRPDLLLLYIRTKSSTTLVALGSHADLFG